MTRKDYLLLAQALQQSKKHSDYSEYQEGKLCQHRDDCEAVANAIAKSNPKFDRDLFLTNCGLVP